VAQPVVYVSGGYRRFGGGDDDLIKPAHHITRSIETWDSGFLMMIDH
jgi:hypothetical protein